MRHIHRKRGEAGMIFFNYRAGNSCADQLNGRYQPCQTATYNHNVSQKRMGCFKMALEFVRFPSKSLPFKVGPKFGNLLG